MTRKIKTPTSVLLKLLFSVLCLFAIQSTSAQEDPEKAARQARSLMADAEEALEEEDPASAEAYYREAISKDPSNATARYNLGNIYHDKELIVEAIERDHQAAELAEEKSLKHKAFHNKGNAFFQQKKYPEAIEAYKAALRNNPNDEETRYNLALAKKMWEKEKQGGGQDDNKENQGDKENEQKENKEQQGDQGEQEQDQQGNPQDQEGGDQKDQQKQDPEKEGEGEQQKEQQGEGEKPEKQQQQQQQQQPVPGQLSPQQVKNLLEAMGNEEKKVQEKMNAEKVQGVPTRAEKDW